ncbi:MAG: 30S ribosomal protein S20 [Candidatus Omnitrophica bacterium]|nr:30S ribosomal protein S20 [Candidatus Omnitrophota bacterium]
MPTVNAAYKALRSDVKKRHRNEVVMSELKTRAKKLESLIAEKKNDEAKKYFAILNVRYMQAASKGIIHKKTASRKISRLAKKLNTLK